MICEELSDGKHGPPWKRNYEALLKTVHDISENGSVEVHSSSMYDGVPIGANAMYET